MNREDLEKLSPEVLGQLNDALHEVFCESIVTLLQDSIDEQSGITTQEVKTAREFVEPKPKTKAAKELLEFLESEKVKDTLIE